MIKLGVLFYLIKTKNKILKKKDIKKRFGNQKYLSHSSALHVVCY